MRRGGAGTQVMMMPQSRPRQSEIEQAVWGNGSSGAPVGRGHRLVDSDVWGSQSGTALVHGPRSSDAPRRQEERNEAVQAPPHKKYVKLPVSDTVKKVKKTPTRLGRAMYGATANNGQYGIIDTKDVAQGCSLLLIHVPRGQQRLGLDIRPGEILVTKGVHRNAPEFQMRVHFVGRSQYFSPGKRVSSCIVGVPLHEWKALNANTPLP